MYILFYFFGTALYTEYTFNKLIFFFILNFHPDIPNKILRHSSILTNTKVWYVVS